MCKGGETYLKNETFESKIKKQMMNTAAARQYELALGNSKESIRWMFIAAIIFNAIVSQSESTIKYLMFLIRALQIILHLPIFRFLIPSNFSMFTEIISPIIMFDVLENKKEWDVTLFMDFDEQSLNGEEILDQMENIGYPTSNCILNLKTLFFLLQIYFQ